MKYKILPAIALLSSVGYACSPVSQFVQHNYYYSSPIASSSRIECPAPKQTSSFLPKYGIENLVAELDNPINISMDVPAREFKLDYVVCAFNSKSSHIKPIKIRGYEESIRFLTRRDYDTLVIHVKNEGNLESEAIIHRQDEGGKEVAYIIMDSKYMEKVSGKNSDFVIRFNFWRFSLINSTLSVILHMHAEKKGLLKPPHSDDDSKSQNELKSIMINDFYWKLN